MKKVLLIILALIIVATLALGACTSSLTFDKAKENLESHGFKPVELDMNLIPASMKTSQTTKIGLFLKHNDVAKIDISVYVIEFETKDAAKKWYKENESALEKQYDEVERYGKIVVYTNDDYGIDCVKKKSK